MEASQVLIKFIQSLQNKDPASSTDSNILEQDSLIALLTLIDPIHFQSVHLTKNLYWGCLHSMDSYLSKHFSLRLQRNFKVFMSEKSPRNQLAAIALFLALKTPLKAELVSIIEMTVEETQTMIIELLKEVEPSLQDIRNVRKLQNRIKELQLENNSLDGLIELALDEFRLSKKESDSLEQQSKLKARKQEELRNEKIALLEKIGINYCIEYSTILHDAYDQKNKLERISQSILQSIRESQETQRQLFQDIRENGIEISFLQRSKNEYEEKISKCRLNYHKTAVSHQMMPNEQECSQKLRQAQKQIIQLKLARFQLKHENKILQNLIKKKSSQLQQASRIFQIASN